VLVLSVSDQECPPLFVSHSNALTHIGKYKWTKARFVVGLLAQVTAQAAFTGWALYLWFHAKDYGKQNECNDEVKYVLLFFSVRATKHWLPALWITILIISAVVLLVATGLLALHHRQLAKVDEESIEELRQSESDGSRAWYLNWSPLYANIPLSCIQ
jgi:hypothetical protein